MKKILLVPGVRFHSEIYIDLYNKTFENPKILIVTSSPKYKFKNKNFNYIFVPFIFKILFRIFSKSETNFFKRIDQKIFSHLVKIIILIINPDIIHSWGGVSSNSFHSSKNKIKILERSSTYLPLQLKILNKESKKLGIYRKIYQDDIKTFHNELKLANKIIVPSKYVFDSYPKKFKNKLNIVYPFSSNIYSYGYKKFNKQKKIIGYVGGNIIIKGLIYLYDNYVNSNKDDFMLWLKIDQNNLKNIPIEYQILILKNKNITICGSNMSMEYFYKSIDVLIQPSVDDGFNMSTIEALSCGVPTYINRNMGSLEFIKKLTPKNTFNIKQKYSLLRLLNSMNLKSFKKDSHLIKNKFNNTYEKFNSKNYLSFDNLFKN